MKLAVIFPSRGMAFSETCAELLENLQGFDYEIFFSHGLSIPNCFNKPLERALKGFYTHFWLVEEDMILPKGILKTLLKELERYKVEAITCDYPVSGEGKASVYRDPEGNAIYGGTGCLLVTREFLKMYRKPVFRTDIAWDVKIGERFEATPRKVSGDLYGLHDVTLGLQAYEMGQPIKVSKVNCGQRRLLALGKTGTNNGEHLTTQWTKLNPEILEIPKITHTNVLLNDGTLVFMALDRATELEKQGKVTLPFNRYVQLIENDVLKELL